LLASNSLLKALGFLFFFKNVGNRIQAQSGEGSQFLEFHSNLPFQESGFLMKALIYKSPFAKLWKGFYICKSLKIK